LLKGKIRTADFSHLSGTHQSFRAPSVSAIGTLGSG
jgi:hypothetical protein